MLRGAQVQDARIPDLRGLQGLTCLILKSWPACCSCQRLRIKFSFSTVNGVILGPCNCSSSKTQMLGQTHYRLNWGSMKRSFSNILLHTAARIRQIKGIAKGLQVCAKQQDTDLTNCCHRPAMQKATTLTLASLTLPDALG